MVEGLFKKWYNPRRSGYYPPTMVVNLRKQMHTYNPSVSYAASSPYTGEPNEVCANPIQRHRLTPPLCKGAGSCRAAEVWGPPVAVEGLCKGATTISMLLWEYTQTPQLHNAH